MNKLAFRLRIVVYQYFFQIWALYVVLASNTEANRLTISQAQAIMNQNSQIWMLIRSTIYQMKVLTLTVFLYYEFRYRQIEACHKLQGTMYLYQNISSNSLGKGFFEIIKKQMFYLNDYPGIQRVHEIYKDHQNLIVIKENVSHISLQDYLAIQKKSIKEVQIISIFYQILRIIEKLHQNKIVHGKLTSGSFVIQFDEMNAHVQLVDLIMSQLQDVHSKEQLLYASPQLCRYSNQGETSNRTHTNSSIQSSSNPEDDIWSCGMILKELIDLELPQRSFDFSKIQTYIKKAVFIYSSHHMDRVSEEIKTLLQKCLKLNVKERITLQEALKNIQSLNKKYINENSTKQMFNKIQGMQKYSQLQMDILFKMIVTHMEKQYQEWVIIFNECDTNFDGSVDCVELVAYFTQLYPKNVTINADVEKVFKKIHGNGDQKLSQKEFIVGMIDKCQLPKSAYAELFKLLQLAEGVLRSQDFQEISEVDKKEIVNEFRAFFKAQKISPKVQDQMSLKQFELYCKTLVQ